MIDCSQINDKKTFVIVFSHNTAKQNININVWSMNEKSVFRPYSFDCQG